MNSYAIIPAAGRSRRMGTAKLLLPWGAATLIEHVLGVWRGSQVDHLVVVVHPADVELAAKCQGERTQVVVPDTPPPEMRDSVAAGLRYVQDRLSPRDDDAWLLAPADLPSLSADVIDGLLAHHAERSDCHSERSEESAIRNPQCETPLAILVPAHRGRRGHPVLFPWRLAEVALALPASEGINQLLKRHAVTEVPAGAAAVGEDVDTLDDYQRLLPR
jgi:molybdenum cofactor cytidylyltransferase